VGLRVGTKQYIKIINEEKFAHFTIGPPRTADDAAERIFRLDRSRKMQEDIINKKINEMLRKNIYPIDFESFKRQTSFTDSGIVSSDVSDIADQ